MGAAERLPSITPQELHRRWRGGGEVEIIDVRSPTDFAAAHVPGARSVPFRSLDAASLVNERRPRAEEPLYVICQSGQRSAEACARLVEAGLHEAINVEGGTRAWRRAGLPVVVPPDVVSRPRWSVVAAGSLVVVASLLGLFRHPLFMLLAAITGSFLVYAIATGACVLRRLVAAVRATGRRTAMEESRGPGGASPLGFCCERVDGAVGGEGR